MIKDQVPRAAMGVKGRPQACVTCRRRKKGCDLVRPSCGQCRKVCIPCEGYTYARPGGPRVERSSSLSSSSASGSSPYPILASNSSGPPTDALGVRRHAATLPIQLNSRLATTTTTTTTPPPQQTKTQLLDYPNGSSQYTPSPVTDAGTLDSGEDENAFTTTTAKITNHESPAQNAKLSRRDEISKHQLLAFHRARRQTGLRQSSPLASTGRNAAIVGQFWESYFPNSVPFPEGSFALTFGCSLDAMQKHTLQNPALAKQMLAIALARAGQSPKGEPWMMRRSYWLYTDALRMVAHDMSAKRPDFEQQLVASRLFSLYESLFGRLVQDHETQARSWLLHGNGEMAIITNNSPYMYATGRAHRLFLAGRHQIIMTSLMQQKRTFLSDSIWKTAPWTYHPKTPRDYLLDVFVDVPSILEGIEAMKAWDSEAKKAEDRYLLLGAIKDVITRLLAWYEKYAFPIIPAGLAEELPRRLTVDMLAAAHVMSLYHTLVVRCNALNRTISGSADPRVDDTHEIFELTRACRVFGHPDAGLFRHHISAFPLITGLQHVTSQGKNESVAERAALEQVLDSGYFELTKAFILSMLPIQPSSMLNFGKSQQGEETRYQGLDV